VWGTKERLFERALPLLTDSALAQMLHAAQICDGLIKGLKHPDWPLEPWDGLRRLVLMALQNTSATSTQARGRAVVVPPRLALHA
jgi:DNA polymerase-3 subunit delta